MRMASSSPTSRPGVYTLKLVASSLPGPTPYTVRVVGGRAGGGGPL